VAAADEAQRRRSSRWGVANDAASRTGGGEDSDRTSGGRARRQTAARLARSARARRRRSSQPMELGTAGGGTRFFYLVWAFFPF
jgi:hypothetical protein